MRRCPLCALLRLCGGFSVRGCIPVPLHTCGGSVGRLWRFVGVSFSALWLYRSHVCRCAALCAPWRRFYGVGVLCIGYGDKIALRGKYGACAAFACFGCPLSCAFLPSVRRCGAFCGLFPAVGVVLYAVRRFVALWGLWRL